MSRALQVRHHSICSVSAASRKLAKMDCPAEIAVRLPGLQGYSARISWHCIVLRVCTQISTGPQPGAPRSGRTTCSQKGQHFFCASAATVLIAARSLASVPCQWFTAFPEAFGGDRPSWQCRLKRAQCKLKESFSLLLWMRSESGASPQQVPIQDCHRKTVSMGTWGEWKPARLDIERISSKQWFCTHELPCTSLKATEGWPSGPSRWQGSFPFALRRVVRTTRAAALCSNKTFVTVWDENPIWYNYFILK